MINVFSCISCYIRYACQKEKKKKEKDNLNVLLLVIKKTNGDVEKKTHNPPREQLYS